MIIVIKIYVDKLWTTMWTTFLLIIELYRVTAILLINNNLHNPIVSKSWQIMFTLVNHFTFLFFYKNLCGQIVDNFGVFGKKQKSHCGQLVDN